MWHYLDNILYIALIVGFFYLFSYVVLVTWRLASRKNITSERLQKIRIVINKLVPFSFLVILLVYLTTLNVPLNFITITLLLLLFWKQFKCYAFGIVMPLFRSIEVGDEILVPHGKGIVRSFKMLGLVVQSQGALIHVGYDVLLDEPLLISKNKLTKHNYELRINSQKNYKPEVFKENLFAILSNTSLIDHRELPELKESSEPKEYLLRFQLESSADISDIKYLLIEKGFDVIDTIQKFTT